MIKTLLYIIRTIRELYTLHDCVDEDLDKLERDNKLLKREINDLKRELIDLKKKVRYRSGFGLN